MEMGRQFNHGGHVVGEIGIVDGWLGQQLELISGRSSEQVVQLGENEGRFYFSRPILVVKLRRETSKCLGGGHEINFSIGCADGQSFQGSFLRGSAVVAEKPGSRRKKPVAKASERNGGEQAKKHYRILNQARVERNLQITQGV